MAVDLHLPDQEDNTTVHTPLLRNFPSHSDDEPPPISQHSSFYVLGLVLTIVFAADLAGSISKAPLIRIYESIICSEYYKVADPSLLGEIGHVEERHCKVATVQEELALLRGWQEFFDYLPGLFLAIPFGMLADRYGRKWLSVLNVFSLWARAVWIYIVCAFPQLLPIRFIWLQGALGVFGGGILVASALLFVITTDVSSESQRANVFFYAHGALCATEFFGPPIGSVLMDRSPWIPIMLSIALLTINIPLSLLLPETLQKRTRTTRRSSTVLTAHKNAKWSHIPTILTTHLPPLGFLLHDPRILFILTTSISYIFAQASSNLTIQYTSRRYAWTLSQTAYLGSVRAVIMLLALLVGLPFASTYLLHQRSFTPLRKDILLLRLSFTIAAAGLLIEGLAPSIPAFITGCCVATMGMGATALIRSLLSSLVLRDEVGRLFAVMSLVWTAAMLVASPVVAKLFSEGLRQGGVWAGLPFLVAGLLFVVAAGAMWSVDLGGRTGAENGARVDGGVERSGFGDGDGDAEGTCELDTEKQTFLNPPSPQTPAFRFKIEQAPAGWGARQGNVPAPLRLGLQEGSGRGRRPSFLEIQLETPLFSPGLRIMEKGGGL